MLPFSLSGRITLADAPMPGMLFLSITAISTSSRMPIALWARKLPADSRKPCGAS